jgi:putative flippase GtrA
MPALAFIIIWALNSMWSGYVLSILWGWFIAPTFGLPALSVVAAIGVAIVVSYLTNQIHPDGDKKKEWSKKFSEMIGYGIGRPLFALGFGWVVHLFM